MNESAKFENYKTKLEGICDENGLTYRLSMKKYPVTLTVQMNGESQMSLFEEGQGGGGGDPDGRLVFAYEDGDLKYRVSEGFAIGDAMFNKLKNIYKNMHSLWMQHFFRWAVEQGAVGAGQMPTINDEGDEDDEGAWDEAEEPDEETEEDGYAYDPPGGGE